MADLPALEYFDNELKDQMQSFLSTFNQKMAQNRNELIIDKDKYLNAINELTQKQHNLLDQIETLSKRYDHLEKETDEEVKDLEAAKLKNEELVAQKAQYEETKQDLETKVRTLNHQITEKRQELTHLSEKLAENKGLNLLELNKFQEYLGLQIEGLKPDLLKFNFKNIDINDYERVVWFQLDLSGAEYKVTESGPTLPEDQVLQIEKNFNEHKDLARFLKEIRMALSKV